MRSGLPSRHKRPVSGLGEFSWGFPIWTTATGDSPRERGAKIAHEQ